MVIDFAPTGLRDPTAAKAGPSTDGNGQNAPRLFGVRRPCRRNWRTLSSRLVISTEPLPAAKR